MDGNGSRIENTVRIALEEDAAGDDITTRLLVPSGLEGRASIIARQRGIISGQGCASEVFGQLDRSIEYTPVVVDGEAVEEGGIVAKMSGPLSGILSGERTALNFLAHLSGVATRTADFVERIAGSGVTVLDTRKTLPGLRHLEKKAVCDGGGGNHRPDLASYILVKENHIAAAGGVSGLPGLLGEKYGDAEIEISSLAELDALASDPPGRIMLDNFSPEEVREAVRRIRKWREKAPEIEVSGGIDIESIAAYAIDGVDYISVGSLTSSALSLDLSLLAEGAGD